MYWSTEKALTKLMYFGLIRLTPYTQYFSLQNAEISFMD